jgi:uncharacterized protein
VQVRHVEGESRFETETEAGPAVLDYEREPDGTLDLQHTRVPEAVRRRGIGGRLVQSAVDHARDAGASVRPTCPFVRAWFERNPGERDVLAGENASG